MKASRGLDIITTVGQTKENPKTTPLEQLWKDLMITQSTSLFNIVGTLVQVLIIKTKLLSKVHWMSKELFPEAKEAF